MKAPESIYLLEEKEQKNAHTHWRNEIIQRFFFIWNEQE